MARESNFFSQFVYEYTSTNDMANRSRKFQDTISDNSKISSVDTKTDMTVYFGGSSGPYIRSEYENRPEIEFCSGSSYAGEWNQFGMYGKGRFTFPNGVQYEGRLADGCFQGRGKLLYPNGVEVHGIWKKGKSSKTTLLFGDGLKFKKRNWKFCQYPDRRYVVCVENGIPAVGQSYVTPYRPSRVIPKECYDTMDGIFNPKLKIIYNPDTRRIIRIPTTKECEWIIKNCRRGTFEEIPEFRKPVHVESGYTFDDIRLKGLSECPSAHETSLKLKEGK